MTKNKKELIAERNLAERQQMKKTASRKGAKPQRIAKGTLSIVIRSGIEGSFFTNSSFV